MPIKGAAGAEEGRLAEARDDGVAWRRWGPYLSERQWGTVREDYSVDGDAWSYFSHDQARSRAYRWGEDGLAGFSDDQQRLCFALALWNGADPILKERLFGLTNREGNHGEDVKEYYFYLDATPTNSYLRYLYKYPQAAFPYDDLVTTNRSRGHADYEYELLDTGVFAEDRYFDVEVEYAKASPEDVAIRIRVANRGPATASLRVLPTLWFRNTWSWRDEAPRPLLTGTGSGRAEITSSHPEMADRRLVCHGARDLLFTENETNLERLAGVPNRTPYVKDGIDSAVVHGRPDAVNPGRTGTKAAADYRLVLPAGGSQVIRLWFGPADARKAPSAAEIDALFDLRLAEANEFYAAVIPHALSEDQGRVMRQALAGMLWSKQTYHYDLNRWLREHGSDPFRSDRVGSMRNLHWQHMTSADVISMPDKWEYPWFAAWDLAFHVIALTLVDRDFAKGQLELMLGTAYLHPNGQLPAYEWNFGDVNPPVHAWATIFTYRLEEVARGEGDLDWLERNFHKLLLNFVWWVNRKDAEGNNLFEGGFLGLDNIGVFDRSAPLPTGGYLEQADGTAWMALFCQNMLEIASELALHRPAYVSFTGQFIEHFLWIATAMMHAGADTGMWDEDDGFFYDVLRLPDGRSERLKVRSMVGLLPMCAVTAFDGELLQAYPELAVRMRTFLEDRPELRAFIHDPVAVGPTGRRMTAILDESKLRRVLARMLDESEFLSPHGIRSLSRHHLDHPFVFEVRDEEYRVGYVPGESDSGMFGGNSNWRGPIWMPVNALIIRALLQYHSYYGDGFTVECPTGSGKQLTLFEVAAEIGRRLAAIFERNESGQRPVYGGTATFQDDPQWRDLILFYEYFHGDNGAGLGASHQTGWTGLIARSLHLFATRNSAQSLDLHDLVTIFEDEPTPAAREVATVTHD
jgi:Glycosyl hydrolase family 63 C-terminal domain